MAGEIIGRDAELRSLHAFLERTGGGLSALVLEGVAGIGKSTLWTAGVAAAGERGLRVLSARPAESERGLAHAGLIDLFEDVLEEVRPSLTPPRRRALDGALLVEDATQRSDARTLAVSVRSAFAVLAADRPVVLAVDDVQWLDPSSARALAFALRRLADDAVLVLLARRVGDEVMPSPLEPAIGAGRLDRLSVGPLSLGATQKLLHARLGRRFARPTLLRVHEASGGNPFYALELARALGAEVDPTQPLPVPETLEELVRARLVGLPEQTRDALVLASASEGPSVELLRRAGVARDALDAAVDAHVVELDEGEIRFTHPLLSSVLYLGLPAEERRGTHGLLAELLVDDPLGRARHLALSTDTPDAAVAATLDDAATVATDRGVPLVAAELSELALRLTPAGAWEQCHRRTISAARAEWEAGETHRAHALALDLLARTPPGPDRAEALILLSDVGPPEEGIRHRRDALREPGVASAQKAFIHQWLAVAVRLSEGVRSAQYHGQTSLRIAGQLDDSPIRALALSALAVADFRASEPEALDLAEHAYALASSIGDARLRTEVGIWIASSLTYCFELDRARTLLEGLLDEWSEQDERLSAELLWHLSRVELRAGRLARAGELIDHAREINVQYAIDGNDDPGTLTQLALVAAHRGRLDEARAAAEQGHALADQIPGYRGVCDAALGVVELESGDPKSAVSHFGAAEEALGAVGMSEPALKWWRTDYAEALLELGLVERAVDLLDAWEAEAKRVDRTWVLASVASCRGLVMAARGDVQRALSSLERAVGQHEDVGNPFARARTLLALGVLRRRARQKRAAREAIVAALAVFEEMGAAGWAEKARAELGRIGGRTRSEGLTAAERRVAALVAQGRTNREVASALVLGERTVETHLTHIYAKLGVRSRTELARTLRAPS